MANKLTQFIVLILPVTLIVSCKQSRYYFNEGRAQGTVYHITYKGLRDFSHDIDSILKVFDKSFNAWDSTSIISRINNNDSSVLADSLFTTLFDTAKKINQETDGMFDITVGPLVKAWGFYKKTNTAPDSSQIKIILEHVGMDKVSMVGGKIRKKHPGVILDVNAIAQGFSVDIVAEFLEKHHVKNYIVEIGGELKAKGKNPKGVKWRVGIDKPEENNLEPGGTLQAIIEISNKAMATSGDYRRFIVENGIKYGHHLNPKTGYPAKNTLLSVTMVAQNCMEADAYATACLVSGLDKTISLLNKRKDLDAYLIYSDNQGKYKVYITKGLERFVQK